MSVSFSFLGYTLIDDLSDLSGCVFTIDPAELNWGTIGIASALEECVNAGTVLDCPVPVDFNPKALDESGRFVLEAEYKELYEECRAAIDWQTECNPDGDFSEAFCWVRIHLE